MPGGGVWTFPKGTLGKFRALGGTYLAEVYAFNISLRPRTRSMRGPMPSLRSARFPSGPPGMPPVVGGVNGEAGLPRPVSPHEVYLPVAVPS